MLQNLEIVRLVQSLRTPFLDTFFKSLNFFDRQEFFFVLIPLVWVCVSSRSGLKILYILVLSSFFNATLKALFMLPRPFNLDPTLGIIQVSGLGFPSGAAQTVILLSGILLQGKKNFWKLFLASAYVLLISFSRIYLGLHFLLDILGGWIVGYALFLIYQKLFAKIEKFLEKRRLSVLALLSFAAPLVLWFIFQKVSFSNSLCSALLGANIGFFISHRYQLLLPSTNDYKKLFLRGLVATLGTFICYGLIHKLPFLSSLAYFSLDFLFVGIWLGFGSPSVCWALFEKSQRKPLTKIKA